MSLLIFSSFVLIAALWRRLTELSTETEQQLARLQADSRRHGDAIANLLRKGSAGAAVQAPPAAPPPQAAEPKPEPEPPYREPEPKPAAAPPPAPPPPPPVLPAVGPAQPAIVQPSGGWEALIGGNLLNKLGALILVIGIALFLGHSFTRMGPGGRAATGLATGAAILAGGVWLERKERYRLFSRGLIAAGWAALYFTSYAMSAVAAAKVIDNPVAGVLLMVSVAAGMVLHSLRYKVESLTGLAFGCVFAALALSELNTLTATALVPLALAMLYLARRFTWDGLALLAAGATYATFLSRESTGAPLAAVQGMLLIYWLMFEAADLLRIAAGRVEGRFGPSLFGLNALAGLGASAAIWSRMAPADIWQYCAASAALYVVSTVIRFALLEGQTRYELALTASALMSALAIFAHVPGLWVSVGMMIEAEALFLAGLYLGLRWARPLSLAAFATATVEIFSRSGASGHEVAAPLALLAAVFYANRYLAKEAGEYFSYAASAMAAIVIGIEAPWEYASLVWLLFGAALFEFGVTRRLAEFRYQSYGVTLLGAMGGGLGHIDPVQAVSAWTYAAAMGVSLLRAIRASSALNELPELERQSLRIGGAVGAALMAGLLAAKVVPGEYLGLAVLLASLALVELALRRLPSELAIPATLLTAAGLIHLVLTHAERIARHPAQAVWVSIAGGALACYALAARLAQRNEVEFRPARLVSPWAGSGLAMTAFWMLLPAAGVPAAWGLLALAMAESGASTAIGSLIAVAGSMLVLGTADYRLFNGAAIAAVHWVRAHRLRNRTEFAPAHGWIAICLVTAVSFSELPQDYLLVWSALGLALALPASQRWQSAVVAAGSLAASVLAGGEISAWHHGVVALWFLAVLAWRRTDETLRPGYSIAAGLVIAAALYREVSGGMLTLSWSGEGIVLLGAGFALRERTLRLSGLALLFGCIGKAFLYDLRNLETTYRILSFVGLGAILLAVSAVYTRFKDSLQRHL